MSDTPVPVTIEVEAKSTVTLSWEDGTTSVFTAPRLRGVCACATCREPAGEQATASVLTGDTPVTIESASLVGSYALSFVFGPDGHGTGIFPFVELKRLDETPADQADEGSG